MVPFATETESLPGALRRTLSDYAGPLAVATLLLLTAGLIRNLSFVPGDPAITWGDVASAAIGVAGEALVIMIAGWSVLSGGQPVGFAALRVIPGARAGQILAYSVIFYLWLFVLLLVSGAVAGALAAGTAPLVEALIIGAAYAFVLVLMWLQLGFLFPDTLASGESGLILAMALGVSTGRRVFAALALPAICLTIPIVAGEALIWDGERIVRLSEGMEAMTIVDWLAEISFAALGMIETAAYMVAITQLYREMVPSSQMRSGMWR